jgi:hypothetical protein
MSNEEVNIEISYLRRYVTGQYQHKEYAIKLVGNEQQLREQLTQKQASVAELIASLETVVTLANQAAQGGKKVSDIVEESSSEPKVTSTPAKAPVSEEPKKVTAKKKVEDEEDIF